MNLTNRFLVVAMVMLFTALSVNYIAYDLYQEDEAGSRVISKIPLEIGRWRGRNVPLEKRVYEILQTEAVINRVYSTGESEVFLSIVYYPDSNVDFHAPEACLGGQGIRVNGCNRNVDVSGGAEKTMIQVKQLTWEKGREKSLVYYFFKAGNFVGPDYIKLRLNLILGKVGKARKSGSLVRISTRIFGGDASRSCRVLEDFLQSLYPLLMEYF